MKSLVNFSDLKLTKEEMTQLNGKGSGGTGTGGPTPGSGSATTTPLPFLPPGFTIPANITVTVGASQAQLGTMAMMAGNDAYFGSTSSGAYSGGHETSHTAQGTGAYTP